MRKPCLIAFVLVLASASGAEHAPAPRSPKEGLPEALNKQVERAIVKGRDFLHDLLRSGQYAHPAFQTDQARENCVRLGGPGADALIGLALVQTGVPPTDPELQTLWQTIRTRPPGKVYTVAFELLFVEGMLHPPADALPWPGSDPRRRKERFPRDDRDLEKVRNWIRKRAEWLASGQNGGAWGYLSPGGIHAYRVSEQKDRVETPQGVDGGTVMGRRALSVPWDPNQNNLLTFGWHDYSNTQCAVLGLRAAALCEVALKDEAILWRRTAQNLLLGQSLRGPAIALEGGVLDPRMRDSRHDYTRGESPLWSRTGEVFTVNARARGWGYQMPAFRTDPEVQRQARSVEKELRELASGPDTPDARAERARLETVLDRLTDCASLNAQGRGYEVGPSPNMTAAGLTGLVLARAGIPDPEEKELKALHAGIRDALAWYQRNWDWKKMIDRDGKSADGYALYGLERLGVLANLRLLGKREWYREGAEALVDIQAKDGSWSGEGISRYPVEVNTAFCLLFLSCGTPQTYAGPLYHVEDAPPGG